MITYLLHFSSPLGGPRHYARHYVGKARKLCPRLEQHRSGRGAAITAAAVERGYHLHVAMVWNGDLERHIKRQKNHSRFCPMCDPSWGQGETW